MDMFDQFETAADAGKDIPLNWIYNRDNESAMEYGEEFQEDLEVLKLNLMEKIS